MWSGGAGAWGRCTCVSDGQSLALVISGAPQRRAASTAASSYANSARRRASFRRPSPNAPANIDALPLAASLEIFAQDPVRGAQRQRRDGQRRIGGTGRGKRTAADQEQILVIPGALEGIDHRVLGVAAHPVGPHEMAGTHEVEHNLFAIAIALE